MKARIRIGITTICLLLLCYLGTGAYEELRLSAIVASGPENPAQSNEHEGIQFASKQARHVYDIDLRRRELYPWAVNIPKWQAITLLAIVGGYIGGFIREMHSRILTKKKKIPIFPVIGVCVSLLAGALLLLVPKVLFVNVGEYRPETVFVFCLLSGCFCEETWEYIRRRFTEFRETAS